MQMKGFILGAACCSLLVGLYSLLNGGLGMQGGGAAERAGKHDIQASPYFTHPDFYNMRSNGHLLLLPHFKTAQQSTGYSCGPVAAGMVVEYLQGKPLHKELEIAEIMGTSKTSGTDTAGMVKYFHKLNWQVESCLDKGSPKNYSSFQSFVKGYLQQGLPIIVENIDWGGHWRVIIGYDDMGSAYGGDDVLILADPFDTSDHLQDGYNVISAERFYYMWFDAHLFKGAAQDRLWLVAKPR